MVFCGICTGFSYELAVGGYPYSFSHGARGQSAHRFLISHPTGIQALSKSYLNRLGVVGADGVGVYALKPQLLFSGGGLTVRSLREGVGEWGVRRLPFLHVRGLSRQEL